MDVSESHLASDAWAASRTDTVKHTADLPSSNRDSFYLTLDSICFFFLDQIKKSSLALCSTAAPCPSKRVHLHCLAVVRISVGGSAGSSVRDYCREPGPFPSTHVRWLSATCNPSSGASDALYWLPEAAASMWYTQSHPDAHTHIISIINKQI